MPENQNQLSFPDSIKINIHYRELDFYHITKAEIDDITTMTIFIETFLSLASILAAGLLTTILTSIVCKDAPQGVSAALNGFFWVFLVGFIICVALFILFLVKRGKKKREILKGSKIKLDVSKSSTAQPSSQPQSSSTSQN